MIFFDKVLPFTNQQSYLKMRPYPWQEPIIKQTVEALLEHGVFINASTTGAGKTVMALETIRLLECPALVIAPKAALTQWKRTAAAMGVTTLLDVINPEKVSLGRTKWFTRDGKDAYSWHIPENTLVVWDEPHRSASGEDSIGTVAMALLKAYKGAKLLAMSATLADSPLKLRGLGWWMGMHRFVRPDFRRWCEENGCQYENKFVGTGLPARRVLAFTKSAERGRAVMAALRQRMGARFVAVSPEEIPGFPDGILEIKLVDLDTGDRKALEQAYSEMSEIMRTEHALPEVELMKRRARVEFLKAATMAELAAGAVSDGFSAVVFCNFTEARLRIVAKLSTLGIPDVSQIYGGQTEKARDKAIDAFQDNTNVVCVVMTEAGGAALSLHDVHQKRRRVSFMTPSFNAASIKQALGRIRRCGGTKAEQYIVLASGTVEETVSKRLARKLTMIDTLNDTDLSVT